MNNRSENSLPENYGPAFRCDMLKDKKLFAWINVLALIAVVPVIVLYILVLRFTPKTLELSLVEIPFWKLAAVMVAMLVYIVIHELIHAIFYKVYTKEKVKFGFHGMMASASVPNAYFYKKPYLVIGLAPAVIMSIVFIVPMFFLNNLDLLIMVTLFIVHFSGCVGDFYISWKLRKFSDDTLIRDYGVGMIFYIKK